MILKKAALKITFIFALFLFVVVACSLVYINYALPDVGPAPTIYIKLTKNRVARGKYLALNVMACMNCHSQKTLNQYAPPIDTNQLGSGGQVFGHNEGVPGTFVASNLTPANLGDWTDGEIYRAITSGVSRDGRALFPAMPYQSYGRMDTEDIYSVIAYLRTLPRIDKKIPLPEADFPMNFIIKTLPEKPKPQLLPLTSDKLAYGEYLVRAADCKSCHTSNNNEAFGGGKAFKIGKITVYSANITSDRQSGIGSWTEDNFISRFKAYAHIKDGQSVKPGEFQTVMPWRDLAQMKKEDLAAIYPFLKSVKPVVYDGPKFKLKE